MAGLDHPVHPLSVGSKLYDACREKSRLLFYYGRDREYNSDGSWQDVQRVVVDSSSTTCRYDLSQSDDKCAGCSQRGVGQAYSADIRARGT